MSDKPYLTIDEVCRLLQVKKATVYGWTHRRKIPHVNLGKHLLFKREDIDAWVEVRYVAQNPTRATETASQGLSA